MFLSQLSVQIKILHEVMAGDNLPPPPPHLLALSQELEVSYKVAWSQGLSLEKHGSYTPGRGKIVPCNIIKVNKEMS